VSGGLWGLVVGEVLAGSKRGGDAWVRGDGPEVF